MDSSHGFLAGNTPRVSGPDRIVRARPSSEYERSVVNLLNRINSTTVGNIVFTRVSSVGRRLSVIPPVDLHRHVSVTPSQFSAEGQIGNEYAARSPVIGGEFGEVNLGITGTGLGATATFIVFTPGSSPICRLTPSFCSQRNQVYSEDGAFLHETIHALRALTGRKDGRAIGTDFHNIEEFIAILIENIYRSSTNRHILREAHGPQRIRNFDDRTVTQGEDVNIVFRRNYAAPLALFRNQEPELTSALQNVQSRFNPLRTA